MAAKIAGKYLSELDPSMEMANAKTEASIGSLRPTYISAVSNPELLMQFKQPSAAFNPTGLGFSF